jgi:hypothetical protein
MVYQLGYKNGLRGSPEYAASLAQKAQLQNDETIMRLEAMLSVFPSKDQCVPIMADQQIDEYAFCEDLLSEQANNRNEVEDGMKQDRDQDWGR